MIRKEYFLLPVLLLVMLFPACLPDDDDPVNPGDPRDKFLGTWKVNETCSRMNYTVQITPDPSNSSQVLIANFGNPGPGYDPAVAIVTSGTITVTTQTIGEGWTVSGTGTYLQNGTIDWAYTLVIGPSVMDCSALFSRQ
jgi:hypothetical protein